jgi:nitroreductase
VEFSDVVRRRRMVREFDRKPLPRSLVDRVLTSALRAPSAGFSQGVELIVLDDPHDIDEFWRITDPRGRKRSAAPAVLVIPLADKGAYLRRYSEPDKHGLGMDVEDAWPVAYWDLDAAMAVMLVLLAATDAGVGAWFFGIFHGEVELLEWLGAPPGPHPIGALALGWPSPRERARGSAVTRRRRTLDEVVHRGRW